MALWIICDRWINEAAGTRCVLPEGHAGPCSADLEKSDALD